MADLLAVITQINRQIDDYRKRHKRNPPTIRIAGEDMKALEDWIEESEPTMTVRTPPPHANEILEYRDVAMIVDPTLSSGETVVA